MKYLILPLILISTLFSNITHDYYNKNYKKILNNLKQYKTNLPYLAIKAKILYKLGKFKESKKLINKLLKNPNVPEYIKKDLKSLLIRISYKLNLKLAAGIGFNDETLKLKTYIINLNTINYNNITQKIKLYGYYENNTKYLTSNWFGGGSLYNQIKSSNLNYDINLKFQKYFESFLSKNVNLFKSELLVNKKISFLDVYVGGGFNYFNNENNEINEYAFIVRFKNKYKKLQTTFDTQYLNSKNYIDADYLLYNLKINFNINNNKNIYFDVKYYDTLENKTTLAYNTKIINISYIFKLFSHFYLDTKFEKYINEYKDNSISKYTISSMLTFNF